MIDGKPLADPADYIPEAVADLLTRTVQVHAKQSWFLKELLAKGDGLTSAM